MDVGLTSGTAAPRLHRRDNPLQTPRQRGGGSLPLGGDLERGGQAYDKLGKARGLLSGRWRLLALILAGLMLHALTAKHSHPMLASGSNGSLAGGIAIRSIRTADGGSARPRVLVEQPTTQSAISMLVDAAADLVTHQHAAASPPPPAPIPEAWLEGGTLGKWPKPYRNKTRQVVPNSISHWKCSQDATNFTLAAATHSPLLQSTEWRQKYGDNVSFYKWCREGLPEEVPQLQQVLKLESNKPRPVRGLTLVTQLSLERFGMLENQCRLWPFQISAVLYIPLLKGRIFSAEEPVWHKKSLDIGVAESLKFFASMEERKDTCILDLEVVVEERCERYSAMLYPANAARNRALVNAKTEMLLLLDVDFAVSLSLADIVRGEATYNRLMSLLHQRNAVVLPAFETQDGGEAGKKVALEAVRMGKPYVVHKFEWNIVFGFHVPQYPQGHQATDYWRWIKAKSVYPVQYQVGYEPYILMHRNYVPFYDERFRGYYWNKVQHLMHISLQNGFNFVVHPTAFVVHVPHKKPSTKWLTRKMGQKEKNHMLFDNSLFHMRQMDFVPVTSFPQLCTPEVAPVLPDEDAARQVAAQKAAAEKAAAEAAAAAIAHSATAAAQAAKRQAEAEEAAKWRAENAEAAAAAEKQKQDAAIVMEQQALQAGGAVGAAAAAAAQQAQAAAAAAATAAAQQAQGAGAGEAGAAAAQQAQGAGAGEAGAAVQLAQTGGAATVAQQAQAAAAAGAGEAAVAAATQQAQQPAATQQAVQQQPGGSAAGTQDQPAATVPVAATQPQEQGQSAAATGAVVTQPQQQEQPAAAEAQQAVDTSSVQAQQQQQQPVVGGAAAGSQQQAVGTAGEPQQQQQQPAIAAAGSGATQAAAAAVQEVQAVAAGGQAAAASGAAIQAAAARPEQQAGAAAQAGATSNAQAAAGVEAAAGLGGTVAVEAQPSGQGVAAATAASASEAQPLQQQAGAQGITGQAAAASQQQ